MDYFEIELPDLNKWESFKGKMEDLKSVYEKEIDSLNRPYDYELEYFDDKGNMEIKIHFIRS